MKNHKKVVDSKTAVATSTVCRIFLGLTEVSGFFARLESGLHEIGVDAMHVPLQSHGFKYSSEDHYPPVVRWARNAVSLRINALRRGDRWSSGLCLLNLGVSRAALFVWVLFRFDVIVMGGGSSFFSLKELPLLRFLGKKVIYTFHGTDIRPPYIDGFYEPEEYRHRLPLLVMLRLWLSGGPDNSAIELREVTKLRNWRARVIEKHADAILCSPNCCHFLSRPFVSFFNVGLPIGVSGPAAMTVRKETNHLPRVLHAPSQKKGKGTDFIRKVVGELRAEGIPFEYVEVSNLPNKELLELIKGCDLVIDQAFSDSPLAGFVTEAGYFGVPAVVGGYYADVCDQYIPKSILPPVSFCRPEHLKAAIRMMILDQDMRKAMGKAAQEFIRARWTNREVAKRFLQVIEAPPADWMCDPKKVFYLQGIGLEESTARKNVRNLIEAFGTEALCLGHNPALEKAFIAFSVPDKSGDTQIL